MKVLMAVVIIFLSGCVSATYKNGEKTVRYNDLFKKASDVHVNWGNDGVIIDIGDISSELTAEDIAAYMKVMATLNAPKTP